MIKRLSLFLLLTMVISWTPITAQETPGPIGVLQVVDSDPLIGSELGAQQPITVYFDRDLACETVDPSVSLTPAIEGAITCDGTALTFTPDQPYQLDTRYTLTLDADRLRGQDGAALTNDVSLEFLAAGVLRVTSTLPGNDSVDVTADSPLTIVFNRPVVPLGVVSDSPDLPTPITIDPPIEGTGEWLNTAIYLFRPAIAWGGGQTYTVTVDDVRGVDGAPLGQPYTFSFTVALPVVLETIPGFDALGIRLKPTIQVTFNQPIDQASLEANFYLRPFNADSGTVSGTFEWNEDRTGFGFTPDSNLRLDTTYLFGFPAFEVKALVGEATLAAFESGFTTVPLPRIVSTDPSDGTLARPYGGFRLIFASPMNPETLPDKIVINPAPVVPPTFFYQEWNDSYSVEFSAEPSTTYNITINPGAEDIYGNTIRDVYTFSYTTMAYDAELNLVAPVGPVGFYDAGRETTGLFITHRNVSQLDLQLYVVPEADFIGALTLGEYYALTSNYAPRAQNLVKSWTIPSVAPENVLRYELLDLAAPSNNAATSPTEPVVCEGALSPRAKIGDQARVIVTPDPLRARATPPDGEIVDLLYADYSFLILDGPICANNIYWWQISLRDGDTAWVAEGLGEEYFFEVTVSGPEITPITPAIQLDGGALPPGIYLLGVSADETQELGYSEQRHFLVVGTANLTMKSSVNEVLVWATDVRTGQPLTGVPISLYGVDQIAIAATTDEQGVARFTIERSPDLYQPLTVVLNDGENFGISFIEWDDGVDPWRFDIGYNFYPDQYRTYLYTERSVYRPGQPIYFRAIVREKDGLSYPVPDFEEVTIRLFDNQGTVVFEDQFALTEFGTVSGQIPLSIDARLGGYNLSIELPVETQYGRITNSIFFDVAEYRLPEYQVTLTPEQPEVLQGEMVRVTVDTEFYFGGPVFDATVDYQIFRYATIFDYEGRGFYNFFDFNEDTDDPTRRNPFYEEQIATGTLRTDVNGQAVIEIPAELGDFNFSQILNIQASVTDSSGQTVSGRTEVIVHQAEVYLGIAPERYVGTAGTAQAFNLITVDWESQPIANQEIQIEVVERRWSNVQTLDPATGRLTYDSEVEEIPVSSGIVTTDADGTARYEFVPPNGGIFKAIATVTDTNGYTARSSTTMWVSGGEYVQWRVDNNNRIELIADQEDYQIGDTAEVLITSPYQGAVEALITIEQGDVLRYERITLEGNSYTYRVPITEDFAPNVFVGVFLAKGVDETNPVASFRVGYVQLNVDNSRKALTIALEADRPLAGPRDTITYTVRTTDYTGEPVAAELGISLVDLAVLSLGNEFSQPSPLLEVFYGRELLGVRTSTPLTINTDYLTQFVLDVIKGGGGGGGGGGVFVIREEFVETPYWNGAFVTDENGEGTFQITLPDNLTTWRLDVRGITLNNDNQTLVGQETLDIVSTKPVLIRPVTPRFFVQGDQVVLAAVVNNNSGSEQTVEVRIEADGVTVNSDLTQTVTIANGSSTRVEWDVTVDIVNQVELIFYAAAGELTDATRPTIGQGQDRLLPVYRYDAPETVGTGGALFSGGQRVEGVVLPQRLEVENGQLTLQFDPSLAAVTLDSLAVLQNMRSQNAETTVSKFLPNIATYRALALDQVGLTDDPMRDTLEFWVNDGLQRLYAQQKPDGGWGWWVQEINSDLQVTAWAVIGLVEAQAAGFVVDQGVLDRAVGFLSQRIGGQFPDQQAFMAYALARAGQPNNAVLATLFEDRAQLSIYAKAYVAMALPESDTTRINTLLDDIVSDAILSANGAHWEEDRDIAFTWGGDTRTTAIVLKALLQYRPEFELNQNVVRWLMMARRGDAWETTQETAWAIMALTDWMLITNELNADYTYSATFNDQTVIEGEATVATTREGQTLQIQISDLLRGEVNRLEIERSDGDGALYYTAYLQAYLPVPEIEPLNRGIILQREYRLTGSDQPITEARIGDLVEVHLTIIAPNELYYVVIEDPLPAGAEGINPILGTEAQFGTQPGLVGDSSRLFGWGWWSWFTNIEFRDERVVLNATYLPAGAYEYVYYMRPSVEGTFNVIPTFGYQYYLPEVSGRGAGSLFRVLPEDE